MFTFIRHTTTTSKKKYNTSIFSINTFKNKKKCDRTIVDDVPTSRLHS